MLETYANLHKFSTYFVRFKIWKLWKFAQVLDIFCTFQNMDLMQICTSFRHIMYISKYGTCKFAQVFNIFCTFQNMELMQICTSFKNILYISKYGTYENLHKFIHFFVHFKIWNVCKFAQVLNICIHFLRLCQAF